MEVLTAWSCWLAVQRAPLVREGAYHVWPGEGPEGLV